MKTIEQVKAEHPDQAAEIDAVLEQFGDDEYFEEVAEDVTRHGADTGWNGFIYHTETVPFAQKHRQLILTRLLTDAEEMGLEDAACIAARVQSWKYVSKDYSIHEINSCLYTGQADDECATTQIMNALAWYLLETVADLFED